MSCLFMMPVSYTGDSDRGKCAVCDTCVIQVIVTEGNVLSVIPVLYR